MKKFFTLAIAAAFGLAANAQDTSSWTNGQDVTNLIQWKAYEALDEDPSNPVWQGFNYGGPGEWEFRPAGSTEAGLQTLDANNNKYFICWGVYNLPALDIYQEFEIPAGVYTLSVAGCYRDGQDDNTLEQYKSGKETKNCFVYVQVGEDTYQTSMHYKFSSSITEPVMPEGGFSNNNWGNEKGYNFNGTTIYSPQSHCCADWYLENGHFAGNDVLFAVPEKTVIRVGIKKPIAVPQDQIWWNHWTMTFYSPFDDNARAMIAKKQFDKMFEEAEQFQTSVCDVYPALGALLGDVIMEVGELIDNNSSLEEIQKAITTLETAVNQNKAMYTKAQALDKNLDICKGIMQVTDYAGKQAFQAAIDAATALLYSEELGDDTSLETYNQAAEDLMQARMDYLTTQEKAADGSYDFTHALSFPWWVNQENTGVHDASGYHYPENVQNALNSCDDGGDGNLETGSGKQGGNAVTFEAVASKAHWSIEPDAENTWVYDDKWNGWHGGMQTFIQKLKGYAGINSDWSNGANTTGAMWVYQNLTHLPEGYYTLEGNVWHNANAGDGAMGWEGNNNYMFVLDGEGNELAKVMQEEESRGYWDAWDPSMYTVLKTDFFYLKGGKARMGYHNNTWMLNSIMELKYYGTEIDYTGLIQQKIADNAPAEDELWPGDQKAYDAMIAKVVFPIAGDAAYSEAAAIINEAVSFKKTAAAGAKAYNPDKYNDLSNAYAEDCAQAEILFTAWNAAVELGTGENDSYKDAEAANAIYNAYEGYLRTFDKAEDLGSDELKAILNDQAADLKAAYASVEKLVAYEKTLATPINKAIFANNGFDKATEAAPADVTSFLLANADLSEGPKTGWTCEGEDVNPGINTYGRALAECWNQQPFTISQTLRSLPAGVYEFSVRACYRDAGTVDQAMIDRVAAGEGQNAFIFANNFSVECKEAIKPTAEAIWTDPSFSEWYNAAKIYEEQEFKVFGFIADTWDSNKTFLTADEYTMVCASLNEDYAIDIEKNEIDLASPAYPFDTKVGEGYYPASMAGFQFRCAKNPEAYCNKVQIYIEEGGDVQLGIKKIKAEASDWLIYDDFKLFYLGATSTGISDVEKESVQTIFNVAGQKLNSLQKGINIVGGKKVLVK